MHVSICGYALMTGSTALCSDSSAGRRSLLHPTKSTGTLTCSRFSSGIQNDETRRKDALPALPVLPASPPRLPLPSSSILKHRTITLACRHAACKTSWSSTRELVSVITTGTISGVVSAGSLAGGSTCVGGVTTAVMMVVMTDDDGAASPQSERQLCRGK